MNVKLYPLPPNIELSPEPSEKDVANSGPSDDENPLTSALRESSKPQSQAPFKPTPLVMPEI
jgi:hypothetical protein